MKILMLNYEYPPIGGGASNANKYILEELTERNIEVDLITSSKEGYNEEEISENINIYRMYVSKQDIHYWTQAEILKYMWEGFRKSRKLKNEKDYDIVHAWFAFPCGLMGRMLGIPYIVSLRGSDVPGYNNRFSLQYIFLKPLIKHVWKKAEKVIPNSHGLKELAQRTLDMEMTVVPNGVDTEKFCPANKQVRDSAKDSEYVLKLLCVSRLTPRKRIEDIIGAIEDLENVNLEIIGEGIQEHELKEKAKNLENKINFQGYIPHDELPEKYRDADVFVMPSLEEGMSNVVLEAISSGLPVITTQVGGMRELVDGNGIIVDKKSPEQIEKAIEIYVENPEKLRKHGKKSREIAETMSWKKVAEKYVDAYREIA